MNQTTYPSETADRTAATGEAQQASRRLWQRLLNKTRFIGSIYLLLLPSIVSLLVFSYYPKYDVVVKAFYRWTPGEVEEYIGLQNFADAVADPLFWQSFKVVAIMLVANLFKMWPAIITAVALHRLLNDRMRYIYQVLFVIPMVIPALVWLLIWKSFYDPDFGILNRLLNMTGMMGVLSWLDGTDAAPGVMPTIAAALRPVMEGPVSVVFSSTWGLLALGAFVLASTEGWPKHRSERFTAYAALVGLGVVIWLAAALQLALTVPGFTVVIALMMGLMYVAATRIGPRWVLWAFLLLGGAWACRTSLLHLPVLMGAAFAIGEVVRARMHHAYAPVVMSWVGYTTITVGSLLVAFGMIWVEPTNQFIEGTPAWLGSRDLVLPALIFWGFPWVGTVGVLIYLAGLQQIPTDVYEAAELDGVGPVRRLFSIELPLVMTQVRINLIFMTIGTLTGYEFYLILLGHAGGPGNIGIVPGLYMYSKAFIDGRFGYSCALGMVLFVMVLLLTIVYQRYVKVDK
ncbi:carbohydrate ABC transporter permease [Mucisphaera calidilacus]|uniref:L-arabinose transport system permease protein AraP n=1 Tax=Mucisphaera calidilacus TaxID=2527982 RepID=A0A518BWY7_9BACT|nr:hypothetical protein [Mucisphaera calidilacus]QDU71493.1 L-arabinose transport system permease protein AraP [Mucisphaera calidilacus]